MGNLEIGLEQDLDLKLNAGFLHHYLKRECHLVFLGIFLIHTYCLYAGSEECTVLEALSHRRNLLLSEVMYWQCSFCLDLWKKVGYSVD